MNDNEMLAGILYALVEDMDAADYADSYDMDINALTDDLDRAQKCCPTLYELL